VADRVDTAAARSPARVAAACMVASGAAAVADEVVWARMLREVFGNTVEAVSTVLAVYFAGLALGAFLAGRLAPRSAAPRRLYVRLELLIAGCAVATLPAIAALARYVPAWEATAPGGMWTIARVVLAGGVLLPATMAMGATYPAMIRVVGAEAGAGAVLGRLYAADTLGGVLGASAAGFVTLGTLGCRATILVAVATNLGVAALARFGLGESGRPVHDATLEAVADGAAAPRAGVAVLLAAAVVGAAALAAEVVWTRAMVFGFGTSTYAFASILIAVLVAIAAGSALYAWRPPRAVRARRLGIVLVLEGVALALSTYAVTRMDLLGLHGAAIRLANVLPRPLTWPILWIGVALVVAGPATFLSGYAFPLAAHLRGLEVASAARGGGQVSAANTAGTILGSLLAGFWLLPALGVVGATRTVAVTLAAAGGLLLARRPAGRLAGAVTAGLAAWLVVAGTSGAGLHADIETAEDRVLFAREGAQASVRVFEQASGGARLRRPAIDGQTIASNGASELLVKEVVLAHLPFALHPAARRVALVGLGTGITLGAIAAHPEVTDLVCVEIVPEVWDAARYFAAENGRVLDDPRLHAVVGDGLQYLRGHRERFDAIVGDEKVSLHAAANGTFFSRDYYLLVREHLLPGGVFVQWVPLILPPEDQRTVLRTFFSVFSDGVVLTLGRFGFVQVGGAPTPRLARERSAEVLARPDVRRALAFPTLDLGEPAVLGASALGGAADLAPLVGAGPLQTADRPVLDYGIARWDFRFETYRARAADTLEAFAALARRVPSPWSDAAASEDEAKRARRAVTALLEAHRAEIRGDAAGMLAALARVDGPEGLPALGPLAARYRALLGAGP
jgi:spermidine synthase